MGYLEDIPAYQVGNQYMGYERVRYHDGFGLSGLWGVRAYHVF